MTPEAVERQYGLGGSEEQMSAVRALAALDLPVGAVEDMKRESVPTPQEILP